MRTNTTTWQRAVTQARKLQPSVRQIGNSLMFDVASTSHLDQFYHVYLGNNKYNPFKEATCECIGPKWTPCVHRAAAFLQYISNLNVRLENGWDLIHNQELKTEKELNDATELWLDLLNRYERCSDLIKTIEQGYDISKIDGPFKDRLLTPLDKAKQLLQISA